MTTTLERVQATRTDGPPVPTWTQRIEVPQGDLVSVIKTLAGESDVLKIAFQGYAGSGMLRLDVVRIIEDDVDVKVL